MTGLVKGEKYAYKAASLGCPLKKHFWVRRKYGKCRLRVLFLLFMPLRAICICLLIPRQGSCLLESVGNYADLLQVQRLLEQKIDLSNQPCRCVHLYPTSQLLRRSGATNPHHQEPIMMKRCPRPRHPSPLSKAPINTTPFPPMEDSTQFAPLHSSRNTRQSANPHQWSESQVASSNRTMPHEVFEECRWHLHIRFSFQDRKAGLQHPAQPFSPVVPDSHPVC